MGLTRITSGVITDYVELYGYIASTASLSAAATNTYFNGFLARAA